MIGISKLLIAVVTSGCIVTLAVWRSNWTFKEKNGFKCKEMPFESMVMPPLDIDASVALGPGDPDSGENAIVVKIVDGKNSLYYFAILNDGAERKYKSVLKHLPLSWNKEYGVGEIVDPKGFGAIPEVFFRGSEFDRVIDHSGAIGDIMKMLEIGKMMNGRRPEFALNILREGLK